MQNNTIKYLGIVLVSVGLFYLILSPYYRLSGVVDLLAGITFLSLWRQNKKMGVLEPKKSIYVWFVMLFVVRSLFSMSASSFSTIQVLFSIAFSAFALFYFYKLTYLTNIIFWTNIYVAVSLLITIYYIFTNPFGPLIAVFVPIWLLGYGLFHQHLKKITATPPQTII